jgi:Zn ribbon nucleic-acid-binding protein
MPWLCGFRKGMELMLTGDNMNAEQCVACGWANGRFPDDVIDDEVVKIASKVARVPADIQQINKRSVHRAMEVMGIRTSLRYGTELQALVMHTQDSQAFMRKFRATELPAASFEHFRFTPLKLRDGRTGDQIDVVHIDRLKLRNKQKATPIPEDQGVLPCVGRSVTISFSDGPVRVDEISFTTAADHPELDPVQWLFEGSEDGVTWTALQRKDQDFPTPTKRLYTTGVLGLDGGKASKAFTERDRAYGDNRVQRRSML